MRSRALVLAAALALGGCATSYVYRPLTGAAPESGYIVARYGVPPEGPQGEVLVTSFGVAKMDVAPNRSLPMLHVRLGASNARSPVPWTLDAREQLATIAGRGPLTPTYANSDSGGPIVTVPPGQSRVLDVFYALSAGEQSDRDVPFFEVTWKVHAGERVVAERTPFQRSEAAVAETPPAPAYFAVGLGASPFWWYDPFFPYPVATIGFPLIFAHPPARFHVVGPPAHVPAGTAWRGHPVGAAPAPARTTATGGGWHGHR